jgi:dTDP-4-amino-4,6-dideoxygalactose transaminase
VQINFENEIDHDFFYIIIITDHNGLSADLPASLRELPYKFIIRDSCLVFRPNKTRVDVDFCSFSNNKFLVGGEGGCLISRDENLMEFVKYRSFSNIQPTIPTPEFMYTGKYSYIKSSSPFKGSISGIVSCVLHEQLQQIAVINEIRQKNHEYLSRYLPCLIDSVVDNPLFFTLKLPDNYSKRRIFALQMHCLASGLQTMIGVLPHKFYLDSKFYKKHVLSLPIHTELSKDDLESIVTIVSQNL